jgi:transposase
VPPDIGLGKLSHAKRDALILSLFTQLQTALVRIAELERRLDALQPPSKMPDNSSLPPSKGRKPNPPEKTRREGPRTGSLGPKGGGWALSAEPDEMRVARPTRSRDCLAGFIGADHTLDEWMPGMTVNAAQWFSE